MANDAPRAVVFRPVIGPLQSGLYSYSSTLSCLDQAQALEGSGTSPESNRGIRACAVILSLSLASHCAETAFGTAFETSKARTRGQAGGLRAAAEKCRPYFASGSVDGFVFVTEWTLQNVPRPAHNPAMSCVLTTPGVCKHAPTSRSRVQAE